MNNNPPASGVGAAPRLLTVLLGSLLVTITPAHTQQSTPGELVITRLKYHGGGDWYGDPSSLPNLISFTRQNTGIEIALEEQRAAVGDDTFWGSTYLYMTGHGNIAFSLEESIAIREHLQAGAFMHADDNYGMDRAFRREMAKVFPDKEWVELPPGHPIFHTVFPFPGGLPKIHEHDGKPPQALGLFHEGRLVVFYSYESDLGDGWEDPEVHNDPPSLHEKALRMGANIIIYALTR